MVAVSERLASEVSAIESALEGHRAALKVEMEMERAALQGDSSGAREVSSSKGIVILGEWRGRKGEVEGQQRGEGRLIIVTWRLRPWASG